MSRDEVAQEAPDHQKNYDALPLKVTRAPMWKWRAHSVSNGAWFFSSDGGGRFDIPPPEGTCYIADSVSVAVRERLGRRILASQTIDEDLADEFEVTEVSLPAGRFAAITSPKAAPFGITRELSTMSPYLVPQAWARLAAGLGLAGIRYMARFSTGGNADAYALFGTAPAPAKPRPIRNVVDGRTACASAKVSVRPIPYRPKSVTVMSPTTGRPK